MFRKSLHLATVIGVSLALSGCASIFGEKFAAKWNSPRSAASLGKPQKAQPELTQYTQTARNQLAAGQTGAALESFRLAIAFGEPVAPAYNGMAIAYARLGNFEHAQQLFSLAIEAAPNEDKYRSNMARLMTSPLVAQRKDGDRGAVLVAAASVAPAGPKVETATPARGKLTRVSRGEFRIATIPQDGAAPIATRTRTAIALAKLPKNASRRNSQAEGDAAKSQAEEAPQSAR